MNAPGLARTVATRLTAGVAPCLAALLLGLAAAHGAARAETAEPQVQRIVTEDEGVRIEELRVRGQTQRIVVKSKLGNLAPYEVLPATGGRDMSQSAGNGRGAAGQRVWNVLSF